MSWIVIPNWDRFQHYKDRDPPWIRLYRSIHDDEDFMTLTSHRRYLLIALWVEYASSDGRLRLDQKTLSRRLQLRVTSADLVSLNDAGFIRVVASKPLALARAREAEQSRTPKPPTKPKRQKVTGWREVRGTHGLTHIPDPFGIDRPPGGTP